MTGISGRAWIEAAETLGEECLDTLVIGAPGALDVYYSWHRRREIDEAGALLVRPDGVVAWRQAGAVSDPSIARRALTNALSEVLGRG